METAWSWRIDQATMKLIDSGKAKLELDSAFLEYGNPGFAV